ncbi:disease resistance protein RPM1-like [Vitis riparia]|uniref:disease resistance protein RPM1-like n=1 Tax=Vitis riparia TaxID=96939 RepID=UPI00155B03A5|nr:disease resistance protein RPM1-like [Vitis riparia]
METCKHSGCSIRKSPYVQTAHKLKYVDDDSTIFWAVGHGSSVLVKHAERIGEEVEMVVPFEGFNFGEAFQGRCPPELKTLSDDIVKRCGGLPLAIVAIGGLLSRKEKIVSEWKKFSDSLGSELESNSHLESINPILSLSYHDLPYHLKSCFLYLAIFPEDYTIKCGILTRLWIAEGFVKAKRGVTLEDTAEEFLTELIHRSLVQVSQVYIDGLSKRCHIHDLMREIILKKAEGLSFSCVMAEEASCFDGRFRRLSVQNSSNNALDITSKMSHIRSIFLYNSEMFSLGTLASKFKLLKVLDLGGAPLDRISEDLGNLFHLRYLSLRKTKVRMLPRSIGKLQNLQTLDLKYSLVEDLPVEISRLKKLCNILCFDYTYDNADFIPVSVSGVHVKEDIGGLEDLQKLTSVDVTHGVQIITELGKLRQLRKLGITKLSRGNGQRLCASISNMVHLKYLSVWSLRGDEILDLQYISNPPPLLSTIYLTGRLEKLPDWISKLPNLVRVGINRCNLVNDPMQGVKGFKLWTETQGKEKCIINRNVTFNEQDMPKQTLAKDVEGSDQLHFEVEHETLQPEKSAKTSSETIQEEAV